MSDPLLLSSRSFVCLLLAAAAVAQAGNGAAGAAAAKPRVHVIGASVSGGFEDGPLTGAKEPGDSVTLQHVLKAWCGEHARATTHSPLDMMAMFTDPKTIGHKQIQAVVKAKPDVVVAIDFPFWFAYGYVDGDEAASRRALLEHGLSLLAQIEAPVLVGDLPDMQGAERRMLNPRQIPSPEVLQQLNAQLAQWVVKQPNVHLVELAETVRTMKHEGVALPLAAGELATPPGALLQGDKLHANRLGMAYLGYVLQQPLRELFPEDHALRAQQWSFERFVEACGAEGDLAALRGAAPAKAKAGAPGKGD